MVQENGRGVEGNEALRPTRVLFIIDSLWGAGGAELSLMRLIRELPKDQFDCLVVTFYTNELARPFRDQFDCPVEHWRLNNLYDVNAFRVAARLRRLVRERRIELVHTFFHAADLWAGPIAKLSGAKVLVSSRRDMGFRRTSRHNLAYKLLRGVFDQIQAVSEEARQFTIRKDKIDPSRALTVYNGVDTLQAVSDGEIEELRKQHGIIPGVPLVTCVANVRRVKGIDILVRAAALVHRDIPEAQFLVAGGLGNAPLERKHQAEMAVTRQSLGTDEFLKFIGPTRQVPALLKMSDLFVLPSRTEGLSNALLEAMSAGLPCVATAVGGNPEVVVDGVTGFLVPPENPEELARAIVKILRDPDLGRRMGAAGASRVRENFTSEQMAAKVTAAYRELLQRKSGKYAELQRGAAPGLPAPVHATRETPGLKL